MSSIKDNHKRAEYLQEWQDDGGVMILGYDMFRNLASGSHCRQKKLRDTFEKCLINPGKRFRLSISVCSLWSVLIRSQRVCLFVESRPCRITIESLHAEPSPHTYSAIAFYPFSRSGFNRLRRGPFVEERGDGHLQGDLHREDHAPDIPDRNSPAE